ncbi:hypothetical protein EV182_006807, partial [Spiromyces aspiralis]
MEGYTGNRRDYVFSGVEVLIYVFDVESDSRENDFQVFKECLDNLAEFSPAAKVFCLIHKIDLVRPSDKARVIEEYKEDLTPLLEGFYHEFFATTIWNFTLYQAWSCIVYRLIPNIARIEAYLEQFRKLCEAVEVVLFEKSTFLVVTNVGGKRQLVDSRYVQISETIKNYNQKRNNWTYSKFSELELRDGNSVLFIQPFTASTFVLVIVDDPDT